MKTEKLMVPEHWCSGHMLWAKMLGSTLSWLHHLSHEEPWLCCTIQGKLHYHCLVKNDTPVNIHCYFGSCLFVCFLINIVVQRTQPPPLSKAYSRKHTAPKKRLLQKPRLRVGAGSTVTSLEPRQKVFTNCHAGSLWSRQAALRPVSLTAKPQNVPLCISPALINFQLDFEPFVSLHIHC